MHQISEIEKLSSGRYYITLDDGLQFPLYGKEMGKYGIEVNEVLSEEAYLEIMLELLPARAKKKALHLLERMDRTEQQLRTKLTEAQKAVSLSGRRTSSKMGQVSFLGQVSHRSSTASTPR